MKCDAGAFAGMYETIYKDLYRFALCMMGNTQDAEDAVSDAVLSAYRSMDSLREERAFKSWMFTILANTCRRRLKVLARRQKREVDLDGVLHTEGELAGGSRAAAQNPDYGMALAVREAFFTLSEEEQTIVGLSVFGGYSGQEISSMLHMNAGTVRSKRSRALAKLGVILGA